MKLDLQKGMILLL